MDILSTTQRLSALPPDNGGPATTARSGRNVPSGGNSSPPAVVHISVDSAVAQINQYLGSSQRELNFSVDRASGQTIIKVVNPNSGEVIRQIPAEEVVKMADALTRDAFHTFEALA